MPTNRREYSSDRDISIRGGYTPFTLTRNPNLETYERVVGTLNEQQLKTAEQRAKIAGALAQTELHHSEDGYKQKLIDFYNGEISKDPFNYIKAQELAGKAASDPELLGKIRANQEYKDFTNTVKQYKDSGKISALTAERLLAEESNQYKFTPQTDAKGRVVGGLEWKAGKAPVQHVELSQIAALAKQLAAPEKGSTDTLRSSTVTNADGTGHGGSTQKGLQWDKLSADKIQEVFDNLFRLMPEARASLTQDYEDDIYYLKKLEKEFDSAKTEFDKTKIGNEIDDVKDRLYDNEMLRSERDYMAHSMGFIIKNMAYDYKYSTDHSTSSVDNQATGAGGGSGVGAGAGYGGITMPHGMMDFNRTENGGTVFMNSGFYSKGTVDTFSQLSGLMDLGRQGNLGGITDSFGNKVTIGFGTGRNRGGR